MTETDLFIRTGVALAIGLLVGMERGWQSREIDDHGRAAGFRTFGLSALLGAITAHLALAFGGVVIGFGFAAFAIIFAAFHWIEAQAHNTASVTSVVAGLVTFGLGALAVAGNVQVAIAAAVVTTVLLSLRNPLHQWIALISWEEIKAGLILLVMTFLLLPLLPDRPVDPWGAINPHEIWLLAIMIAMISMVGYIAIRLFGDRFGILVTAAAGGLASSTATTLTLSRLARSGVASVGIASAGIAVSASVMLIRVGVIATGLNRLIGISLWLPLLAGVVVQGFAAATLILVLGKSETPDRVSGIKVTNPLELSTSLKFAALMAAVMLAVKLVSQFSGNTALLIVSALSGIADVDAITVSLARSTAIGDIAADGILLAVAVNSMTKAVLAFWVGGKAVGIRVLIVTALGLFAGATAYFLF
jgi:uncharacterized membrane protein (DUF4010 family)